MLITTQTLNVGSAFSNGLKLYSLKPGQPDCECFQKFWPFLVWNVT